MYLVTINDDTEHGVDLHESTRGRWSAMLDDGASVEMELRGRTEDGAYVVLVDGTPHTFRIDADGEGFTLIDGPRHDRVRVVHASDLALDELSNAEPELTDTVALTSPITGIVLEVLVVPGQRVEKGQGLVVVEAMKMENMLTAERDAIVTEVCVSAGETVFVDDAMLRFE